MREREREITNVPFHSLGDVFVRELARERGGESESVREREREITNVPFHSLEWRCVCTGVRE